MYVILVADAGAIKTTSMLNAQHMFMKCFPEYPLGVSKTSPEDLVRFMASEHCQSFYKDENETQIEWRPLANFVGEFSDWLVFNPVGMLELLTGIFDQTFYVSSTLARGKEPIIRPYLSLFACTTPVRLVDFMKTKIVGGGFARRVIFAYETKFPKKTVFSQKVHDRAAAENWCEQHLLKLVNLSGKFEWTQEAKEFIEDWWAKAQETKCEDIVLQGYFGSKDTIVQKIAMCVAMAQPEPKLLLTRPILETAIALVESNEDNLDKLTIAVGRNELALPRQKLLQLLAEKGGMMPEFVWHKMAAADMNEIEYRLTKSSLVETRQIVETTVEIKPGYREKMIILFSKAAEMKKNGELG